MKDYDYQKIIDIVRNISTDDNSRPFQKRTPYYHMGATIVDSVLQAGLNYRHVVYPRVEKLIKIYNNYKSTCDFIILYQTIPLSELIEWKNQEKIRRIHELSWLLFYNHIENEDDLSCWLDVDENIEKLSRINGIGNKTIDYLKMLSGKQAIAIDRHLYKLLEAAGISVNAYDDASHIYNMIADTLGIDKLELDQRLWTYMSRGKYEQMTFLV